MDQLTPGKARRGRSGVRSACTTSYRRPVGGSFASTIPPLDRGFRGSTARPVTSLESRPVGGQVGNRQLAGTAGAATAIRGWRVTRRLFARSSRAFLADHCPQFAAAISYYAVVSLFPLRGAVRCSGPTARVAKDELTRRVRERFDEAGVEIASQAIDATLRLPAAEELSAPRRDHGK